MPRYWLTTHWPPLEGEEQYFGACVCEGRQGVGVRMRDKDKVLIYESRTGPDVLQPKPDGSHKWVKREIGREGIVAIAEITGEWQYDHSEPVRHYRGGMKRRWCWGAGGRKLTASGFVPRARVARIMGYKVAYNFRGFGTLHSGLVEIDPETYRSLVDEFRSPPARSTARL